MLLFWPFFGCSEVVGLRIWLGELPSAGKRGGVETCKKNRSLTATWPAW